MQRITTWMNRSPGWLLGVVVLLTGVLAVPFLTMAPTESASTEPEGRVFEARDLAQERFISSVLPNFFIVEAMDGEVLDRVSLIELRDAADVLRSDPEIAPTLFTFFDAQSGAEVVGLVTIADLVDDELPAGLEGATDAEVVAAASQIIDAVGPDALSIGASTESVRSADGIWSVPALAVNVLSDTEVLGFGAAAVNLGGGTEGEEYARDLQAALRTADGLDVYGVAIDVNLTSQEQGQVAGPFIGFTILAVLVIVGLVFRSYWVLAIVGAALGALMVWLKGISNLIGLQDDLVLSLIVPIAMISFGVDFAFHGIGRYREARMEGKRPRPGFVSGVTAVSGALVLALTSDAAAFLSNITSGIESIIQFGIGAAIALTAAFLLLGVVSPLVVAIVEDGVPAPSAGIRSTLFRIGASLGAASFYMGAVLLMVFVLPWAGIAAYVAAVALTVVVPYLVRRRSDAPIAEFTHGSDVLARPVGVVVTALARARIAVIPVAVAATIVATTFAVDVEAAFDVEDFFASDTDFVTALDLLDVHVGDRGGEPAVLYVEGPLTDPDALAQLDRRIGEIEALDTEVFARRDGRVLVEGGVFGVFDRVFESQVAAGFIARESGTEITDVDRNGIPDTVAQVAAVYEVASEYGVPIDAERLLLTPDDVRTAIAVDERGIATQFSIGLVNSREQASIEEGRDLLAPIAAAISADFEGSLVQATGGPFVRQESLDATNRALMVSLPIAVIMCVLIGSAFLRSFRYGLVGVLPILMTVAWLYAFMERAGYSINIVTATIAAVSIGIGIDFAIHYIVRFREELGRLGERLAAVRAAAEGTGSALVASAISSAVGFGILALAPMPLFAAYGLLTAVMIAMALVATLAVLPGVLVLVTKDAPVGSAPRDERKSVLV